MKCKFDIDIFFVFLNSSQEITVNTMTFICVCVHVCVYVFQVTRHLLKLFDNIADLRFKGSDSSGRGEEDGEAVAMGMYSREGEYVLFSEPCVCEGQVLKNKYE